MSAAPGTPYLLLDLDAFERNVARMASVIVRDGGKRWRPHVKAIRSPVLARRLVAAGASGVTCSNVADASTMVEAGIPDVLVATQVHGDARVDALAALNRGARVLSAVDDLGHARTLGEAALRAGVVLPVLVEVDIGLARAGVAPGEPAVALAAALRGVPGIALEGLMGWEGHTTRLRPAEVKARAVRDAVGLLTDTASRCRAAGIPIAVVSCGGTGTFPVSSHVDGVTEIEAGGGVFGDARYRLEFDIDVERALLLRTTVVSRPTPRRIVCDAGWKAAGVHPRASAPIGLPGPITAVTWSAEHVAIELDAPDASIRPGAIVDFEVGYADATVFLHRHLFTTHGGRASECLTLPAHG